MDRVFQHMSRDDLKHCLFHLNRRHIGQKARAQKALQHFQGTCAFFGEPKEKRAAPTDARRADKAPVEKQPVLVNAREARTKQIDDIPAHHVSFEDFSACQGRENLHSD